MKILVADNSEFYRHGLKSALTCRLPLSSFVHARSGKDALDKVNRCMDLDLVILDLNLPDMRGLYVMKGILRKYQELPVVLLSAEDAPFYVQATLIAGGKGFLLKSLPIDNIASAIQVILAGGVYFPPGVFAPVAVPQANPTPGERKREVLALLSEGYSNKGICRILKISEGTLKTRLQSLF